MIPSPNQPRLDLRLHYRQGLALQTKAREVLYGGAAGAGKSFLMRAASIIWSLSIPGLETFLFRRNRLDLLRNHMGGTGGYKALLAPLVRSRFCYIYKYEIHFANGSKIFLNYCENEDDADNYRGQEFHVLLIDELTLFTEKQYRLLQSRVRMEEDFKKANVPEEMRDCFPRILCGTNPGGPGHHFAKTHWVDHGEMTIHAEPEEEDPDDIAGEPYEPRTRQFIPGKLRDNPSLNPREYKAALRELKDPLLVRAMLNGDWTVIAGAYYAAVWRPNRHIIEAGHEFAIPVDWKIWRGADDGFASPLCHLWLTEDPDTGTIYVIDEIYGEGILADVAAERGLAKDKALWRMDDEGKKFQNGQTLAGIIDSGAFADHGQGSEKRKTDVARTSRGDVMNRAGMKWKKCRKWLGSRQSGWQDIYRRLEPNPRCPDKLPGLRIFSRCANLIRTLPAVMRDKNDPEDIDTDGDDHAPDALRYGLQWKDPGHGAHDVG